MEEEGRDGHTLTNEEPLPLIPPPVSSQSSSAPPPPKLRFASPDGRKTGQASAHGGVISAAATRGRWLNFPSFGAYLMDCWQWCAYETHAMLLHWMCALNLCPADFKRKPHAEQLSSRWVRFNLPYWLCFWLTVPFLLAGTVLHDTLGQGPSHFEEAADGRGSAAAEERLLRSATSERAPPPASTVLAERHIRVHWLYVTDGFYLLELCVGFADLAALLADGEAHAGHEVANVVASELVLPCCLITGNLFFLSAIQGRRHWTTRYFILVNCCYALAKVVGLLWGTVTVLRLPQRSQFVPLVCSYLFETACFCVAVFIYSRLWSSYEHLELETALAAAEAAAKAADTSAAATAASVHRRQAARPGSQSGAPSSEPGPVLRDSSAVTLFGFGSVSRVIEGLSDRIEQKQATTWRVLVWLPCTGKDEVPIITLLLMVLTCALIWGSMMSTLVLRIGWLSAVQPGGS